MIAVFNSKPSQYKIQRIIVDFKHQSFKRNDDSISKLKSPANFSFILFLKNWSNLHIIIFDKKLESYNDS